MKPAVIVVELVRVPLTQPELDALDRVAAHYGLDREDVLKLLLFREDSYGQASRKRVAAGAAVLTKS